MRDRRSSQDAPPAEFPSLEAEADLVRRLKLGDEDAFESLLGLYWNGLLRFALRVLQDRDRAEDVVQEAFIQLWNRRAEWKRTDTVRPLLYRIVRNRALNEKRRANAFRKWAGKLRSSERDPTPTPLDDAETSDLRTLLRKAVDSLPERRREIFVLIRYHRLSYREAAETLGLSPQTVANQLSRAMKDLREALEPHVPYYLSSREAPVSGGERRLKVADPSRR